VVSIERRVTPQMGVNSFWALSPITQKIVRGSIDYFATLRVCDHRLGSRSNKTATNAL
jgi:hypothetical protein